MYYLGIDLGGTNIVAGLIDEDYKIIGKAKLKTNTPRPSEDIIDDMAKAAEMAISEAGADKKDIAWVGIGTPGIVNKNKGIVEYSCNLGFDNVPMVKMIEDRLGLKCYIENDANAAAYGELIAGAGKGVSDFVAITLGTGVGGGVIANGKMINGLNCAGGELGHIVINMDGEECSCGRKGCWEAYASATALIRQTRSAMEKDKDSLMWGIADNDIGRVNGRTAFDAMRAGDKSGSEVVKKYIEYVGCGIANIINIFRPEVLCVGGGICNEKEYLMAPLREYVEKEAYGSNPANNTVLKVAELGGDAGLIGAAFLGRL